MPSILEIEPPGTIDGLTDLQGQLSNVGGRTAKTGGVLSRKVFFEHLKILSFNGGQVMVVADQTTGLKVVDQFIDFIIVSIHLKFPKLFTVPFFLVPMPIEPDTGDFPIIGQKFGELCLHEIDVLPP